MVAKALCALCQQAGETEESQQAGETEESQQAGETEESQQARETEEKVRGGLRGGSRTSHRPDTTRLVKRRNALEDGIAGRGW
ncbi:MAG: hypothetical protein A3F74_11815 [Betaproteobacteria bacterium RIFCSPLOWO2_12_FULL_62_58]|nr:MAG: hypothetical protein A3F74_11815 [Betaproteobacteria bacterium RIFCSPLOWO2_12_FULL_62_58]